MLSPLKVGLYLVGGLIVIVSFADRLPHVLSMVFREALTTRSAMGFGWFIAMRYGIARGVYANEAGYGTAAVAYGTARSDRPSQQGLQAVMEVFIVSFVTGTISALTILVSGVAETSIAAAQSGAPYLTSTAAVAAAFNAAVPTVGGWVVAFCAFLFGYTTLIGWAYYGEQFLEYILGPLGDDAVSLDLLPADSLRRGAAARGGVGVGRPDERAAGLPEHGRADRPERGRGRLRPARGLIAGPST